MEYETPLIVVIARQIITGSRDKTPVTFYVFNTGSGGNSLAGTPIELQAGMRIRGGSTAGTDNNGHKLQYSVKLQTDWPSTAPTDHFLGMKHGGKHWVFNQVGVVDLSFMRNALAFHMQRHVGSGATDAWAPRTAYFEMFLYCEQTSDSAETCLAKVQKDPATYYHGVYINMEKIRPEKHRVPIDDYGLTTESVGGFMVQLNDAGTPDPHGQPHYVQLENGNVVNSTNNIQLYRPENEYFYQYTQDPDKQTVADQLAAIKTWFFLHSAADNGWYGWPSWPGWGSMFPPANRSSWSDNIPLITDFTSFAQYVLINEVCKDPDGYHRSTFMYKTADTGGTAGTPGKMHGGPLWDKNKSFANPNLSYGDRFTSEKYWTVWFGSQAPWWWEVLLVRDDFKKAAMKVWQDGQSTVFNAQWLATYLDTLNATLTAASPDGSTPISRNVSKWGQPSSVTDYNKQVSDLKTFLTHRLTWMSANIDSTTTGADPLFTAHPLPYPPSS